jgi:hypothetical protein
MNRNQRANLAGNFVASVAAFTAPTSPLMMTATRPSLTSSRPDDVCGLHHGISRKGCHVAFGLNHSIALLDMFFLWFKCFVTFLF